MEREGGEECQEPIIESTSSNNANTSSDSYGFYGQPATTCKTSYLFYLHPSQCDGSGITATFCARVIGVKLT